MFLLLKDFFKLPGSFIIKQRFIFYYIFLSSQYKWFLFLYFNLLARDLIVNLISKLKDVFSTKKTYFYKKNSFPNEAFIIFFFQNSHSTRKRHWLVLWYLLAIFWRKHLVRFWQIEPFSRFFYINYSFFFLFNKHDIMSMF